MRGLAFPLWLDISAAPDETLRSADTKTKKELKKVLHETEEGWAHLCQVAFALRSGDQVVHGPVHRHGVAVRVVSHARLELVEPPHHLGHVHPDPLLKLHVHLRIMHNGNTTFSPDAETLCVCPIVVDGWMVSAAAARYHHRGEGRSNSAY